MSFASQFNFNKDRLVKESTTISTELAQYVDHAYGFRRIHPDYTGFCCRVKRQDNEQADVFFDDNGRLSLNSKVITWEGETGFKLSNGQNHFGKITGNIDLVDFIGNGTGELTRIYDQGNAPSGKINLIEMTGYVYRTDGSEFSATNMSRKTNFQILSGGNFHLKNGRPTAKLRGRSIMYFDNGLDSNKIPSGLCATGSNNTAEAFLVGSLEGGPVTNSDGQDNQVNLQNATVGTYKSESQWRINQLLGGHENAFVEDMVIGIANVTGASAPIFYYEGAPGSHAALTGKGRYVSGSNFFSCYVNREGAGFKVDDFRQTGQFTGGAPSGGLAGSVAITGKTKPSGVVGNNINPKFIFAGGPGHFAAGYRTNDQAPGNGNFQELIFSTQKLDSTKRFGIEKYMMDEFKIFKPTGMENLSDSERESIGIDIAIPEYGATIRFKSQNSDWRGSSFYNFTTPLGVNNLHAEIDLSFTLDKSKTRKLLRRLESATTGPLTGNIAFSGSDSVINFGEVKNNFQINLDTGYYQNFKGSQVGSYDVDFISDDLYRVNLKLYNNRISPFLKNGTGYVANRLVAANLSTKKTFDVFTGAMSDNNGANSNVFDNYFYLSKDIGNKFNKFQLGGHPLFSKVKGFTGTANEDGTPATLDFEMPASNLVPQGPSGDEAHPGQNVAGMRFMSYLDKPIEPRAAGAGITDQVNDMQSSIVSFKGFLNSLGPSSGAIQLGCVTSHPSTHGIGADGFGFFNPDFHQKRSASSTGNFGLASSGASMLLYPADAGSDFEFRFALRDAGSDLNPFGGLCIVAQSGESASISDIKIDIEHTGFQLDYSEKGPGLRGLTTYTGFTGNATRTFFFQPDRQTTLNVNHDYRKTNFKNSFNHSLNVSRNTNNIGEIDLTFTNRPHNETYAILHFLETHLGHKQFVYNYSDNLIEQRRVFYCDQWTHTFNYKNSNTVEAKFIEVVNPVTPNF